MVHTHRVARQPLHPRRFALVAIASACVLAGTMIGGAIAISGGSHAQRASASTTPAQVVVAPAPVVVAPAPAPAPAKVTITPIEQPAPQPAPIPADTRNTIIVAEEPAPAPQPVQAVQPAPRHHPHQTHHVAVPVVVAHAEPAPAPVAHAPAQPTGATGTLELSTKPPCEIVIDGKATGLMTPRRGIALSPGHHEVTLTNADQGIQLTTEVTVTAGQSVRMIRDFTK